MKSNNKGILTYFLSRSLFLGGGMSILFQSTSKDTYIGVILGILLGIILIYIISIISTNIPLKEYLKKHSLLNIIIKIIYFLYLLFLIFILLIILSTFIYSYFLPLTPSIISCLPFIFLACFLNTKSIKYITYVAEVLFILSLVIVTIKTFLLTPVFEINNILPIFTTSTSNIFMSAIIYACLSIAPNMLMIDENINFKVSLKYYLISSLTNIVVIISIILVMGNMVAIYSYPEYSVLRKISFFGFIENIENIISMSWFFDIFICMSLCSLKLKNIINTTHSIFPFLIVLIIMYIVHIFISNNFYNSIFIYNIFTYIFLILLGILILLFSIKKYNKH